MTAPRRTAGEDIAGLFHNLDLDARVQALEHQVLALQDRVHTLEVENQALRGRPTIPESVAREADHEMVNGTSRDLPGHQYSLFESDLFEHSSWEPADNKAPEHISSSAHQETSPPLSAVTQDPDYTVWYENSTLNTNAPAHLLTSSSWTSLIAAFTTTSTYLTSLNRNWPSLTHPDSCIRGVVQKGTSSSVWTVDSPGEFCCKRCLNTQRVCLKYNAANDRLEALPLPEEVRDGEFGLGWFVAGDVNMSTKGAFKELWK